MVAGIAHIRRLILSAEFICIVIGLSLRYVWFQTAQEQPFFYAHVQDSALYHELAQKILAGGMPMAEPFGVAPLYALFLAAMYHFFGADPTTVYLAQIGLSAVTIGLAVNLGRRLFGVWGAVSAGLAAAVYPAAIIYDVRLLSVGLGTLFTVATAYCAHRAWRNGRSITWLLTAMTLGLGALVRGNLLLVAPVLLLVAFIRGRGAGRWGSMTAVLLGLGLTLGPSTWHNHHAGAGFVPVSLGGGINLYRGNNPYFVDAAVHPFRLPAERDGLLQKSWLIASMDNDRHLSPTEADRYWIGKTIMAWYDAPIRAVGITLRKLTQVLSATEIGDHMDLDEMAQRNRIVGAIPPVMMPIGVLGLLGLLTARRQQDAGVAAVLVTSMLSVALFFVVSRYRAPLVPLLGIYAGGGLRWLWNQWGARSRLPLVVGLSTVAATGLSLSLPVTHAALPWNWMAGEAQDAGPCAVDRHVRFAPEVEEQFGMGIFAMNHGRLADAEKAMWAVLHAEKRHTAAGVNLSWLLLQKGAPKQAAGVARRVVEVDPCDDKAWSNMATAYMRLGNAEEGFKAAVQAAKIDPHNPGYDSMVGEVLMARGAKAEAKKRFERALRWQPDLWQAQARLGRMALQEGNYEEASKLLQAAVLAQPGRPELIGLLGLSEVGRGNPDGARNLLQAAVKSGMKGPALTLLARALATSSGP